MRFMLFVAATAGLAMGGGAYGQDMPSPGAAPAMSNPYEPFEQRGLDERFSDLNKMRDYIDGRTGLPRSSRPVPARPEDIKPQSEVRDSKGLVIGTISSVKDGFAVVSSALGRVEVEFASFAKNNKGLMINMRKAKIEAMMAGKL
jgi:hypothetical protein